MHFLNKLKLFLVLIIISGDSYVLCQDTYVTIETPLGFVRGIQLQTTAGNPVYTFRGIPFAEPPEGALRFQPPVAISPWTEVRDAIEAPAVCKQLTSGGDIEGEEDCLYLNVFSPELPSETSTLKPVLVEIHGGCYDYGSGTTTAHDYYLDNGLVYVTINFRVGALGFMSTGDLLLPGNCGMKDQVMSLQWVQNNIAVFGGNPEEVTIFGQSSGASAVHYHILSPLSQGLFHRGISASGVAVNPGAFGRNATDRTFRYASYLGYTAQNTTDLMNFLMTANASDLIKSRSPALSEEDSTSFSQCVWVPSVEPEHDGAFLAEEPWVLVSEGRYSFVPYLLGYTSYELLSKTQEGGAFATEEAVQDLNDNFDAYVAHELRLSTREEQLEASAEIRQFYYGDSEITLANNDTTATVASDLSFVEGIDAVVRNMSQQSTEPVYYYQFSFNGPLNDYPDFPGACHTDDVAYLNNYDTLDSGSDGYTIGLQMNEIWVNFVKLGNPTPGGSSLINVTWERYTTEETNYLEFASPLRVGTDLNKERMDFWHSVVP